MFFQKHSETAPCRLQKGYRKKRIKKNKKNEKSFFRTPTVGSDLTLVWKYVEFFLEFLIAWILRL
jgi:hypothetical protein